MSTLSLGDGYVETFLLNNKASPDYHEKFMILLVPYITRKWDFPRMAGYRKIPRYSTVIWDSGQRRRRLRQVLFSATARQEGEAVGAGKPVCEGEGADHSDVPRTHGRGRLFPASFCVIRMICIAPFCGLVQAGSLSRKRIPGLDSAPYDVIFFFSSYNCGQKVKSTCSLTLYLFLLYGMDIKQIRETQ